MDVGHDLLLAGRAGRHARATTQTYIVAHILPSVLLIAASPSTDASPATGVHWRGQGEKGTRLEDHPDAQVSGLKKSNKTKELSLSVYLSGAVPGLATEAEPTSSWPGGVNGVCTW